MPAAAQGPEANSEVDEADGEVSSTILGPINTLEAIQKPPRLRVIHRERARWPRVAAKKRTSGCVIYGFTVDGSGSVGMMHVVDASSEAFIEPGKEALRRSQFHVVRNDNKDTEDDSAEETEGSGDAGENPVADSPPHVFQIQLVWKLYKTPLPVHDACEPANEFSPRSPAPEAVALNAGPMYGWPQNRLVGETVTCEERNLTPLPLPKDADRGAYPRYRVTPQFPRAAQEQGLSGCVTFGFTITDTGSTRDIYVIDSSSELFERNGIRAIEQFCYAPGYVDGEPSATPNQTIRLIWELEGEYLPDHPACNQ